MLTPSNTTPCLSFLPPFTPFETASAKAKRNIFRPRRRAWRRWRLRTVLAIRKWPLVGRRVRALTESALTANVMAKRRASETTGNKPSTSSFFFSVMWSVPASSLTKEAQVVAALLKSIGLRLKQTHLSFSDTFAAAEILRMYSTLLADVTLHESSMDNSGGDELACRPSRSAPSCRRLDYWRA